jgi:hypothetical protein
MTRPTKDFDELLRRLPLDRKRATAAGLVAGARPHAAWRIDRFFSNGARGKGKAEQLELARAEGIFELVYRTKDRLDKQALLNDLWTRFGIDLKLIEEEVARAGGENLVEVISDKTREIAELVGSSKEGKKLWRGLAEAMWDWFAAHEGRFFYDAGNRRPLLFYKGEVHEVSLTDDEFGAKLWGLAGFNRTEPATKFIIEELKARCAYEAPRVHQHSWARTDVGTRAIYLNLAAEDGSILKLADGKVETIPNGVNDDEVLLRRPTYMNPFVYDPDRSTDKEALAALQRLVVANIATRREDALMTLCWGVSSLLHGFTSLRPIFHFQGPQGSGKTGAAKLLWTLLYGNTDYQGRQTLPALTALGAQAPFLIKDDLTSEEMRSSLVQYLKATATGMGSSKRTMGTDDGVSSTSSTALLALTGITEFEASDLRERIYLIPVSKSFQRPDWVEALTMMEVIQWRGRILSALLRVVAEQILPNLEEQGKVVTWLKRRHGGWSKTRLDEFFALMVMIARRIVGPMGFFKTDADPDALLFGEKTAAVLHHSGELAAHDTDDGLIGAFIAHQDALAKEVDVGTSAVVHWMTSLHRHLTFSRDGKERDKAVQDPLTKLVTRIEMVKGADDRWVTWMVVDAPTGQLRDALSALAKDRGQGAEISREFASANSLAKRLDNDGDLLTGNGIVIEKGVKKLTSGTRMNRYRFLLDEDAQQLIETTF